MTGPHYKHEHDLQHSGEVMLKEEQLNARAIFWRRMFIGFIVAWMLVMTTISVIGIILIRNTQQTGSPVIIGIDRVLDQVVEQADSIQKGTDASVETNDRILDCLDPGGDCYRESRKNGANQVLSINKVTIYAAACAVTLDPNDSLEERYREARHCVAELARKPVR